MEGYLGETIVPIKDSPFADYSPTDWAMEYIQRYGQIDGGHHKAWVLDQVARILKGAPITVSLAKWKNGEEEWRYEVGECAEYLKWVDDMKGPNEDGEFEYSYDEGIAP